MGSRGEGVGAADPPLHILVPTSGSSSHFALMQMSWPEQSSRVVHVSLQPESAIIRSGLVVVNRNTRSCESHCISFCVCNIHGYLIRMLYRIPIRNLVNYEIEANSTYKKEYYLLADTIVPISGFFRRGDVITAVVVSAEHAHLVNSLNQGGRNVTILVSGGEGVMTNLRMMEELVELLKFSYDHQVRKVQMLDGVTITRSEKVKDEIVLDGNDIELVSRSATLINQKCHVKKKDIRNFLDGIYVSEKGTIAIEAE
ncbi:hypothetical protein POM88_031393 [Heracleum sosnowskyi]|uniref:Large ribosomal subunit protein uL6 alpha-beta domain-containing protein n=1 Tax=Heracleum sosnowskyi TaxID=360622 RepID=A0AAD8HXR6_9APIA|nr:hypothetical protein POM88_031393 [Heracleum sosnowskyi]